MAIEAAALNRVMLELDLGKGIRHRFVAASAEDVTGLEQVGLVAGGVRVVAFHTIALDDDLVGTDGLRWDDLVMAGHADGFRGRGQQLAVIGRVGIVAPGAFLRLHGGVHEFAL